MFSDSHRWNYNDVRMASFPPRRKRNFKKSQRSQGAEGAILPGPFVSGSVRHAVGHQIRCPKV